MDTPTPKNKITSGPPANTYKFDKKERDAETGNDNFGARFYISRFGRFLSVDWSAVPAPVPYANLTNPQSLNLYAFVSDNPATFADLDGHFANTSQGGEAVQMFETCPSTSRDCELAYLQNTQTNSTEDMRVEEKQQEQTVQEQQQTQEKTILQRAKEVLDSFNEYLGFGMKTNCSQGGDCVNALGMAVTAVIAAVASGGASEEAFVDKQIATAGTKIEMYATKALTSDTLAAANREINGGMKVAKAGGGVFEHANTVENAIRGLTKQTRHLERVLQRSGLSESQVKQINGLLKGARVLLEVARQAITKDPI